MVVCWELASSGLPPINYTKNNKGKERIRTLSYQPRFQGEPELGLFCGTRSSKSEENWSRKVWLPRWLAVSASFTQHSAVHRTTGDMDPPTPRPVTHHLNYITNPPSTTPHLDPARPCPVSAPPKESLNTRMRRSSNNLLHKLLTEDVPDLPFFASLQGNPRFYCHLKNAPGHLAESKRVILA